MDHDAMLDGALDELDAPDPTIQALIDKRSLKWIFVGGPSYLYSIFLWRV